MTKNMTRRNFVRIVGAGGAAAIVGGGAGGGAMAAESDAEPVIDIHQHQDKLMFGSDCNDLIGRGPGCSGSRTIAAIRRLAASKEIERKILCGNAKRLLGI